MFTAQFTEHILNKFAAHKRLVQAGVSAIIVGDTVKNCYTISQLAKERFKEIEQEEQAEMVATTTALFKQIATRCQAKDGGDFWPTAISQAAGALPLPSSSSPDTTATAATPPTQQIKFNILEELLRPSTTTIPSITEQHSPITELQNHQLIEDLSDIQDYSQPTATATALATATSSSSPSSPPVIYITWSDVCSHVVHNLQLAVHFLASTVEERSGESPILCAAREQQQWLTGAVLETADSTREWCRGAMLWPQIEVQRISALRYRVDWYGVTFPVRDILSSSKSLKNKKRLVDLTHTL